MMRGDQLKSARQGGPGQVAQVLSLLAELFEARVVGKRNGRHSDPLSLPAVRYVRPKGGSKAIRSRRLLGWAQPCPRTGGAPQRLPTRYRSGARADTDQPRRGKVDGTGKEPPFVRDNGMDSEAAIQAGRAQNLRDRDARASRRILV